MHSPPVTRKQPIADIYHGTKVVDDYRWLESWENGDVQAWSKAQNQYAREVLDDLPAVKEIRARITEIESNESPDYYSLAWKNATLFAIKRQPPLQQPLLVALDSADQVDHERTVVDPNRLDKNRSITIDWYVPSPDGSLVAVSLSSGGSESGDVHVFDVHLGRDTGEVIPRVNTGTAGGDLAWSGDGSGFFYTRHPRPGERPDEDLGFYQQVYYHQLGTPTHQDRYEIGKEFPHIAETHLEASPTSGHLLATVQYGDSGRFALFLRKPDSEWQQLADFDDQIVQARFGPPGTVYLLSRDNAPRGKILRLKLAQPDLEQAKDLIPQSDDTIVSSFWGPPSIVSTPERLYVVYQLGGPSEVRAFDHRGRRQPGPPIHPVSNVGQIVHTGGEAVLFWNASYIDPPAWYKYLPDTATVQRSALASTAPVDFSDAEVVREFAVSKDGTRVPVNIVRRKGIGLDGSHPTLLTGYGGFGVSISPRFRAVQRVWIEQGGVYAVANLRGGCEFGEQWHQQGRLTKKQNVFDDFAAVMQHLIDRKYTNPDKLAITGGSNGGLLMGAMVTQHSHLCKAVVSFVGIYDMLRVEQSPNGAFNIPEFGTVTNVDQFRAMVAYSPYHRVKDGTHYPAVLFLTGANDPRVDPMQSRKMTARLQAATASDAPVLLRTSADTGHGSGTPLNERIEQYVDMYAFLFHQLDVDYRPVADDKKDR